MPSFVLAATGPTAYLVEQVKANYSSDGTPSSVTFTECNSNPCMYGYVQVKPSNTVDVLQYIRVNISDSTSTNLRSNTSYRGSLGSATAARVTIDVNTTQADPDTEYNITSTDLAPSIRINLTNITNWLGGYDIYDADNVYPSGSSNPNNTLFLNFSICNLGTIKNLAGVNATIQFNKTGTPDSVNVTTTDPGETGGAATRVDSDSGGGYDQVFWTGTINANSCVYVWFNITTTEGLNFNGNSMSLDNSYSDTNAYYQNLTSTLSGKTISGKFSRGPIRQGVDISNSSSGTWNIRGFLENRGNGTPSLAYVLTNWSIYQISSSTGTPMTPANQSGNFQSGYTTLFPGNGSIKTTDSTWTGNSQWYNTGLTTKPYYGVSINWSVAWNDTNPDNYYGYINSTYDLRALYKIDQSTSSSVEGSVNPQTAGDNITINNTVTFLGDNSSAAKIVKITSVIPARTTTGQDHGNWTIHTGDIQVWLNNGTWYQLTSGQFNSSYANPDSSGNTNGYVSINITNVAAVNGGNNLRLNEQIRLRYKVNSSIEFQASDKFNFTGNSTLWTVSGTPEAENLTTAEVPIAGKMLTAWKELIGDVNHPTWINSTLLITVTSSDLTDKITGIKFMDYVPQGTNMSTYSNYTNLKLSIYNDTTSSWSLKTNNTDYRVYDLGLVTLPDGLVVRVFEINSTGTNGWSLGNGEKINVTYTMDVQTSGAYVLPTIISAFDPDTGTGFTTTAIGSIYVTIPEDLVPLEIEEGEFTQAKMATVNKPVLWMKDFQIYNPNARPTSSKFSTRVFDDTSEGYVSYYNEQGEKVEEKINFIVTDEGKIMEWESTINPFETRDYELRILTPPVLEVDRNVEVLEKLPDKKVKISMDVFLKNFGKEDYENVVLNLPIGVEDLIQARDSFGNQLQFSGGKDSSKVIVDYMKADSMKSVNIIYKQSYPTIIVTPQKDEFVIGSPVGLNILVINGGEQVDYPYLEVEIYTPGMDVIESDVLKIESMEPLEKTELTEEYFLPVSAPTGLYLASVSFRQDFATLASGTGQFFLTGGEEGLTQTWGWILLLIVILTMGIISYKRLQSVREDVKNFKNRVI